MQTDDVIKQDNNNQSLEMRLRNEGAWCSVRGDIKHEHLFVAFNPKSGLAVSLCFEHVVQIGDLHAAKPVTACLVCALFDTLKGGDRETMIAKRGDILERVLQAKEDASKSKPKSNRRK